MVKKKTEKFLKNNNNNLSRVVVSPSRNICDKRAVYVTCVYKYTSARFWYARVGNFRWVRPVAVIAVESDANSSGWLICHAQFALPVRAFRFAPAVLTRWTHRFIITTEHGAEINMYTVVSVVCTRGKGTGGMAPGAKTGVCEKISIDEKITNFNTRALNGVRRVRRYDTSVVMYPRNSRFQSECHRFPSWKPKTLAPKKKKKIFSSDRSI